MKYLAAAMLFLFTLSLNSALAQDPVKLSPDAYKVLLDNEQVRVLDFRLPAGGKEAMHSHPRGFVYLLEDAKIKSTSPDGKVEDMVLKKGEVRWREATTHAVENVGTTDARVIVVELKKPGN